MSNILTFAHIQLTNWRWSWPSMLITGIVVPILLTLSLGAYSLNSGDGFIEYAIVGGLAFSLLFEMQGKIASNISFVKTKGALDQMAATGATRIQFIIGSYMAFSLLTVPSLLVTPIVVVKVLDLSLSPSMVLVPAIALTGCVFLSVGTIIGALSSSLEQASSLSTLLSILSLSLGPVAVPESFLPPWLLTLGKINPSFYAGKALRSGLFGSETVPWDSLLFLATAATILTAVAIVFLPWRDKAK
ncbi:ABC transporter permease [Corynebacterium striatum]